MHGMHGKYRARTGPAQGPHRARTGPAQGPLGKTEVSYRVKKYKFK